MQDVAQVGTAAIAAAHGLGPEEQPCTGAADLLGAEVTGLLGAEVTGLLGAGPLEGGEPDDSQGVDDGRDGGFFFGHGCSLTQLQRLSASIRTLMESIRPHEPMIQ
jgi:hypothetical protein